MADEKKKKSIYEFLFGRDDIPISTEVTFTEAGKQTILIGLGIITVGAIVITAIIKNNQKR